MSNQQKRDSKGRFVKTSKTVKIYGFYNLPWDDSKYGYVLQKYFLVKTDKDFYFYDPILDRKDKLGNTLNIIQYNITNNIWTEISYLTLQREFPNNMDKINEILGLQNVGAKVEKLTLSDIKIGSLYYNFGDCAVCRIIEVVGRLIYASWHKGPATPYGVSSFRKATKEEIDNYLKEAEELKE